MSCDVCQRNALLKRALCKKVSVCIIVDGNRDVCKTEFFCRKGNERCAREPSTLSLSISLVCSFSVILLFHSSKYLSLRPNQFSSERSKVSRGVGRTHTHTPYLLCWPYLAHLHSADFVLFVALFNQHSLSIFFYFSGLCFYSAPVLNVYIHKPLLSLHLSIFGFQIMGGCSISKCTIFPSLHMQPAWKKVLSVPKWKIIKIDSSLTSHESRQSHPSDVQITARVNSVSCEGDATASIPSGCSAKGSKRWG